MDLITLFGITTTEEIIYYMERNRIRASNWYKKILRNKKFK